MSSANVAQLREDVIRRPWAAEAHLQLAGGYLTQSEWIAARQEYRRAGALGASRGDVEFGVGATEFFQCRYEEALLALQAAVTAGNQSAAVFLAANLFSLGRREEATGVWQNAGETVSSTPPVAVAAALCQAGAGDRPAAIAKCLDLVQADPDFLPSYLVLGQLLQQEHRLEEAVVCYRRLHDSQPREASYVATLAEILFALGRFREAEAVVRQAFRDGLRSPALEHVVGCLLKATRRYAPAVRVFERLLDHPVLRASSVDNILDCYLYLNEHQQALAFIEALPAHERELPTCVFHQGEIISRVEGVEAGLPYRRRYAELRPDDVAARCNYLFAAIGAAEQRGLDMENLPQRIAAMEADFPDSGHVDLVRGRRALMAEEPEQALADLTVAVQKLPDNADAHFLRGEAIRQVTAGRGSQAMLDEWQQAVRLGPTHVLAWWALVRWSVFRGNHERAQQIIERAVRAGCRREDFEGVFR